MNFFNRVRRAVTAAVKAPITVTKNIISNPAALINPIETIKETVINPTRSTLIDPFVSSKPPRKPQEEKGARITNITPHTMPADPAASKFVNVQYERDAKNFTNQEPEILLVAEYFVSDKSIGCLVVWEKFRDATHYEVFKRNTFQSEGKFERILFLDSLSLQEETANYIGYLRNTLGLNVVSNNVFIILDTSIKEDRIYEYKIRAGKIPKTATEVDYDFILESQGYTKQLVIDSNNRNTVYDFAGVVFGSNDLAWIISLLSESVTFFGVTALDKSLASYSLETNEDSERYTLIPVKLDYILNILNSSFSLFGIIPSMSHMLKTLGGLGSDFQSSFIDSIDQTNRVFSYDKFRESIKTKIPSLTIVLQISESANVLAIEELSKLSIRLPLDKGTQPFSSIESLTKLFKFVNDCFIAANYSQEKTEKIRIIQKRLLAGEFVAKPLPISQTDVGKPQAPKPQEQKPQAPKTEAPKQQKPQAPKTEAPKQQKPKTEAPKQQKPQKPGVKAK